MNESNFCAYGALLPNLPETNLSLMLSGNSFVDVGDFGLPSENKDPTLFAEELSDEICLDFAK